MKLKCNPNVSPLERKVYIDGDLCFCPMNENSYAVLLWSRVTFPPKEAECLHNRTEHKHSREVKHRLHSEYSGWREGHPLGLTAAGILQFINRSKFKRKHDWRLDIWSKPWGNKLAISATNLQELRRSLIKKLNNFRRSKGTKTWDWMENLSKLEGKARLDFNKPSVVTVSLGKNRSWHQVWILYILSGICSCFISCLSRDICVSYLGNLITSCENVLLEIPSHIGICAVWTHSHFSGSCKG